MARFCYIGTKFKYKCSCRWIDFNILILTWDRSGRLSDHQMSLCHDYVGRYTSNPLHVPCEEYRTLFCFLWSAYVTWFWLIERTSLPFFIFIEVMFVWSKFEVPIWEWSNLCYSRAKIPLLWLFCLCRKAFFFWYVFSSVFQSLLDLPETLLRYCWTTSSSAEIDTKN